MKFVKMHGLGNDYVFVDCRTEKVDDPVETAIRISDRHLGIGADGLVMMLPDDEADIGMRIFNADGSEAEICGNACRCIAKYAWESGWCRQDVIRLKTIGGIYTMWPKANGEQVAAASVDMGPVRSIRKLEHVKAGWNEWSGYAINLGNPHFVIIGEEPDDARLAQDGSALEHNPCFPDRANIEFVRKEAPNEIRVRVWERGSGITRACGSGACASFAAAREAGLCDNEVEVILDGGRLKIAIDPENGHMIQTGPAETVFQGEI